MKLARWMNKAKVWVFTARAISTPWRVAPALVVGTVLAAGAAVYLNMAFGSETGSPSYEQQRVADSIEERLEVQEILEKMRDHKEADSLSRIPAKSKIIPDDEWRFDSPYYDDFSAKSDRPSRFLNQGQAGYSIKEQMEILEEIAVAKGHSEVVKPEAVIFPEDDPYASMTLEEFGRAVAPKKVAYQQEIERLERRVASLLAEAARDPAKNTPQLNREIERLDAQIDMLRLNSMQETLGNGPSSRDQGQVVPGRPYLGTEYPLDSAWQPFGSLLPDTEYYRDPDYNERHMRTTGK